MKICRYVLAVATIAAAYGIVQLPFAIYYYVHQKRLIRDGYLPDFDFYGDKVLPFNYLTYIDTHNIEKMLVREKIYILISNLQKG